MDVLKISIRTRIHMLRRHYRHHHAARKEDNTMQGYVYIANCPEKCVIRSWYKPVVKTVFFGGFGLSYKLPFDRMVVLSRSPEMVNKR